MADQPKPEPILRGVFSLYETPDGGYHISYRADGEDEDRHVPIPGIAVKLMNKRIGGKNALMNFLGAAR